MESTIAETRQPQVTVGVDTHKQFHVAHAVDALARSLGAATHAQSMSRARERATSKSRGRSSDTGIEL